VVEDLAIMYKALGSIFTTTKGGKKKKEEKKMIVD
jgi:hypothetical protein